MSVEFAAALALLITCLIGFGICALSRWHQKRYLRVPNRVINEHRITLRFAVGSDCKNLGDAN